jgi:pyrimidine deaminase RibD-like protein
MGIDVFEVPFIQSPMKAAINNATSTRQNLNSATGFGACPRHKYGLLLAQLHESAGREHAENGAGFTRKRAFYSRWRQ